MARKWGLKLHVGALFMELSRRPFSTSLVPHPSIVLVLGKRGSGKTALGYRLLELLRGHAEPYVVGIPAS